MFELPGAEADALPPVGQPMSLVFDPEGVAVLAAEELGSNKYTGVTSDKKRSNCPGPSSLNVLLRLAWNKAPCLR